MTLLAAVIAICVVTLLAVPKFAILAERNTLRAARDEIASTIANARAAAMEKGRTTTLRISGNQLWVTVATSNAGGTKTVVPAKSLMALYRVSLASTDTTISFDRRGFATPRLSSTGIFRIVRGESRDSVCVTRSGLVMARGC